MHLEEEGYDRYAKDVTHGSPASLIKERLDPLLDNRVDLRLKLLPLRGVGEDLCRDAAALCGVGNDFVNDVIGVERLDAELVQKLRKEGFAAGNPSRQCDYWAATSGAALTLVSFSSWTPSS